jgi:hypothetical protein
MSVRHDHPRASYVAISSGNDSAYVANVVQSSATSMFARCRLLPSYSTLNPLRCASPCLRSCSVSLLVSTKLLRCFASDADVPDGKPITDGTKVFFKTTSGEYVEVQLKSVPRSDGLLESMFEERISTFRSELRADIIKSAAALHLDIDKNAAALRADIDQNAARLCSDLDTKFAALETNSAEPRPFCPHGSRSSRPAYF